MEGSTPLCIVSVPCLPCPLHARLRSNLLLQLCSHWSSHIPEHHRTR